MLYNNQCEAHIEKVIDRCCRVRLWCFLSVSASKVTNMKCVLSQKVLHTFLVSIKLVVS